VSAGDTDAVIRLVATDLDGTLWGADLTIPVQQSQAIGELARRGVAVLAATSRRARVVRPCLERAGVWLPAVLLGRGGRRGFPHRGAVSPSNLRTA
jgi:hydroxymethylpyrimidine pyrophosphatase-like HAD family hydrolase